MNVYLALTREFNDGRLRAVISSGQAVVLHRLAVMSKDGDWIVKEDAECLGHVLTVLARHGARYRFGAPLDARWMSGGWSSHFEFRRGELRVRTDFFTRPPRISARRLREIWKEQEGREVPFVGAGDLADMKKTDRERDYPVIAELARLMTDVRDQFLYSLSARDLIGLAEKHPDLARELAAERAVLGSIPEGRRPLQEALYRERIELMLADEERLSDYKQAAGKWSAVWPELRRRIADRPLLEAHDIVVESAEGVLPFRTQGERNGGDA
jgi:hypothetical protein